MKHLVASSLICLLGSLLIASCESAALRLLSTPAVLIESTAQCRAQLNDAVRELRGKSVTPAADSFAQNDSVVLSTVGQSASGRMMPPTEIRNEAPKGFGANHNAVFAGGNSSFFCAANPDVRLESDLFPALMKAFNGDRIAVAGPLVRSPDGRVEDRAGRRNAGLARHHIGSALRFLTRRG